MTGSDVGNEGSEPRTTVLIVAVAAAYVVAGLFSSALQQHEQVIGIYWPAAGVAVGGLLVASKEKWPALIAALLALQVGYNLVVGTDLLTLLAWSSANTLGHLLVASLVLRWRATGLGSVRAVLAFGGAAFLGSIPAALVGALGSVQTDPDMTFAGAGIAWLVGDWLGVLTLAPLVLVVGGRVPWPKHSRAEQWSMTVATVIVAGSLFTLPDPRYAAQLSYLVLLPLLWSAIRLRTAGVVVGVVLTTVISVTATTFDRGPFAVSDLEAGGRSVLLHLFLLGMATTALLLASRTVESEAYRSVASDREHLIAAVSHELRTPLTPIVGFSELILARDQTMGLPTRQGLVAIHRNGRHLTALIDNLLLLNGSRNGQSAPIAVPTDVMQVVRRHVAEREQLAGVELASTAADTHALVAPSHLEQIVANLLENALKYGAPPVRVEVELTGECIEISVLDHGPGAPEWLVPQLFEPFTQAVTGDRRGTIGLGLGLAICRELASENGGTLRYERDRIGGARFTLRLPRAMPEEGGRPVGHA